MERLFIGRHGRVNVDGSLLPEGIDDAHKMAERLRDFGISRRAILLSSTSPHAVATAEIIKLDLTIPTMVRSPFIYKAGNYPQAIQNVWNFTSTLLEACDVEHTGAHVMMVTHLSLVKTVAGSQLQHGGVYEVTEDWQNPEYIPDLKNA